MNIRYTKRTQGLKTSELNSDPDNFVGTHPHATKVLIEGSYPNITEAYITAGIPTEEIEPPAQATPKKKK